MISLLQPLFADRLVIGFPEQRLAELNEKIFRNAAEYCIISDPRSLQYQGMFRIAEVAGTPGSENRILADLIGIDRFVELPEDASIAVIERLVSRPAIRAVPVINAAGLFVGLVTRESFSAWQLTQERQRTRDLEKRLGQIESDWRSRVMRISESEFRGTPKTA